MPTELKALKQKLDKTRRSIEVSLSDMLHQPTKLVCVRGKKNGPAIKVVNRRSKDLFDRLFEKAAKQKKHSMAYEETVYEIKGHLSKLKKIDKLLKDYESN